MPRASRTTIGCARFNLCKTSWNALIRTDFRPAPEGLDCQIACRIGPALCKFGVALVNLEVPRRNGAMAERPHLSCFAISAASGERLPRVGERQHERSRSNDDRRGRQPSGACPRHLRFPLLCGFCGAGNLREHSGPFLGADAVEDADPRCADRPQASTIYHMQYV